MQTLKKKYKSIGLCFLMLLLLLALPACGKKEDGKQAEKVEKDEQPKQSIPQQITFQTDDMPMSNNPYNKLSYYLDGNTYIKEGTSIFRFADGSEDRVQIYTDETAAGIGFTIHENAIYAYKTLVSAETGSSGSEIVRMNLDGSEPVSLLTYEGLTGAMSFYDGNMYLWVSDDTGNAYKGYQLNEDNTVEELADDEKFLYHKVNEHFKEDPYGADTNAVLEPAFSEKYYGGVFYRELQESELPKWDINFESNGNVSGKLLECYGDILITPYGIYKISEEGNSIIKSDLSTLEETTVFTNEVAGDRVQLFSYDEEGIYFCTFGQDGGSVYQISGNDNNPRMLVSLQELGITVTDQNMTNASLLLNAQHGYVYLWSAVTPTVTRVSLDN